MSFFKTKSALFKAIENADIDTIKNYIGQNADEKKKWLSAIHDGDTVLTKAVKSRNDAQLSFLIEEGADVNLSNGKCAPLGQALLGQQLSACKILLKHGANPQKGLDGQTPIYYACMNGMLDFVQLLIEAKADFTSDGYIIGETLKQGQTAVVDLLIKSGIDPTKTLPVRNMHLMHYAAASGKPHLIEYVMKYDSDLTVTDKDGNTPLHTSSENYHYAEVTKKLLQLGAPLDAVNNKGKTPLQYAQDRYSSSEPVSLIKAAVKKQKDTERQQLIDRENVSRNEWALLDAEKIAHICTYPVIQRQITEIFNFESRERMTLVEHLKTAASSSPVIDTFDGLDQDMLKNVFETYRGKGGICPLEKAMPGKTVSRLKHSR